MRAAEYPLFLFERDDGSFRTMKSPHDLWFCEQVDIEDGLYEAWDSRGCHCRIEWQLPHGPPMAVMDNEDAVADFERVVNKYFPPPGNRRLTSRELLEHIISRIRQDRGPTSTQT